MTRRPLPPILRDLAERALLLARDLEAAEAIQWQAPPVIRPRDDTTERASGGHGDPTFALVADERRLAVRDSVLEAYDALEAVVVGLGVAHAGIDGAVARYYDQG